MEFSGRVIESQDGRLLEWQLASLVGIRRSHLELFRNAPHRGQTLLAGGLTDLRQCKHGEGRGRPDQQCQALKGAVH
jgi:hypothetical protein